MPPDSPGRALQREEYIELCGKEGRTGSGRGSDDGRALQQIQQASGGSG